MSGYTITLTDSEYDALKARIAQLEESLAKYQACRVHDVDEKAWLSKRVTELEAALNRIIEGEYTDKDSHDIAAKALWSQSETPVSTLCAVCDQIKELHPNTHPWTAKETNCVCSSRASQIQIGERHMPDCPRYEPKTFTEPK